MDAGRAGRRAVLMTALIGAASLAACSPGVVSGSAGQERTGPPEASAAGEPESRAGDAPRGPDVPIDAPPPPVPRVLWPRGWRLVETGSFGGSDDAVAWYRLEGPAGDPGDAARTLLEALSPLAGPGSTSHVASPGGRPDAVGQLEGPRRRAGLVVRREGDVLGARVMLHPPGP